VRAGGSRPGDSRKKAGCRGRALNFFYWFLLKKLIIISSDLAYSHFGITDFDQEKM